MLTIIEKEIKKREILIGEKAAKTEEAKALREKADLLDKEAAEIDIDVLNAEIEELKGYLPKADPATEQASGSNCGPTATQL